MQEGSIIEDNAELDKLCDKFFYGKISNRDKKRLYDHFYAKWGVKRDQAALIILTTHPDYEKPDENGIIWMI